MFYREGEIWPPGQTNPKVTPTAETRFWVHWAKIHNSQAFLLRRVEGTKKWKKHARVQLHPSPHRTPPSRRPPCFACHVGSDGGHNQTHQISDESVAGVSERQGQQWPSSRALTWRIALTTSESDSAVAIVSNCEGVKSQSLRIGTFMFSSALWLTVVRPYPI